MARDVTADNTASVRDVAGADVLLLSRSRSASLVAAVEAIGEQPQGVSDYEEC